MGQGTWPVTWTAAVCVPAAGDTATSAADQDGVSGPRSNFRVGSLTPPRSPQVQQQGVYAYRRQASILASNLAPEYLGYACRRQTSQSTCANSQIGPGGHARLITGPTSTRRDLFPVHFERNFDSPDSFGVAHRHTLTHREKICSMERLFGHLKEISGICKTAEIP